MARKLIGAVRAVAVAIINLLLNSYSDYDVYRLDIQIYGQYKPAATMREFELLMTDQVIFPLIGCSEPT